MSHTRNTNDFLNIENSNRFVKQASSPKLQASSFKPEATSSVILEPRYMDIGEVLGGKGPRAFTMINVFLGCVLWNEIWCGENLTLLPLATFNSTVKKCPEVLYPNRSGQPSMLRFSIRIHWMEHVFFLRSCHNFRSGLTAFFKVTSAYSLNPASGSVGALISFNP